MIGKQLRPQDFAAVGRDHMNPRIMQQVDGRAFVFYICAKLIIGCFPEKDKNADLVLAFINLPLAQHCFNRIRLEQIVAVENQNVFSVEIWM